MKKEISIVIPVYGCPGAIPELHRRLKETLDNMKVTYEIIMVDDCDGQGSWEKIEQVASLDKNVIGIRFAHNSGQDRAIAAGVNASKGDYVITMDCDLQDAPENIPIIYNKILNDNIDIVFTKRKQRPESFMTRFLSKLFHRIFSYLSEIEYDYEIGSFLIANRKAVEYYLKDKGRCRDYASFMLWTGLKHEAVYLDHDNRFEGKSSYTFKKKMDLAIRSISSFSTRLLYVPIYVGFFTVILSVMYIIVVIIAKLVWNNQPEGWSTIVASVFLFGGLILSTLGIIGIYIGNTFDIVKDRPLYIIEETINDNQKES